MGILLTSATARSQQRCIWHRKWEPDMAAIDATMVSAILNNTLPVATGAKPTNAWLGMVTTSAMYIRLNSTASTGAASGTQLVNAYGYLTNGTQFTSITRSEERREGKEER